MAVGSLREFPKKEPLYEDPRVASGGYNVFPEDYFEEDYLDYPRQETPNVGNYQRWGSLGDIWSGIKAAASPIYDVPKTAVKAGAHVATTATEPLETAIKSLGKEGDENLALAAGIAGGLKKGLLSRALKFLGPVTGLEYVAGGALGGGWNPAETTSVGGLLSAPFTSDDSGEYYEEGIPQTYMDTGIEMTPTVEDSIENVIKNKRLFKGF